MADIDVKHPHKLTVDEVNKRIEVVATDLSDRYGLKWRWHDDRTVKFEGRGVKGELVRGASDVAVKAELPFLLRGLKGQITARIETKMKELLG